VDKIQTQFNFNNVLQDLDVQAQFNLQQPLNNQDQFWKEKSRIQKFKMVTETHLFS